MFGDVVIKETYKFRVNFIDNSGTLKIHFAIQTCNCPYEVQIIRTYTKPPACSGDCAMHSSLAMRSLMSRFHETCPTFLCKSRCFQNTPFAP